MTRPFQEGPKVWQKPGLRGGDCGSLEVWVTTREALTAKNSRGSSINLRTPSFDWINDGAVPSHNGNGFAIADPAAVAGVMMDPSAFMGNPAQFNPQFANPQQLAMQNTPMRNASPSFPNAMYQTNSVIPSKRARPREDSIGQSPRQAPGMLPTSRAETPQQSPFPGYQPPGMAQQQGGQPSPYPHLQQNGSANATPSPIMSNQMRPGSVPQRVSTASPHPFSPAAQQFPQTSPVPSEHGGNPQAFMQQNAFPQGFNPQFTAQSPARPSPSPNPMGNPMMAQHMTQMQGQLPQQIQQMPQQMQNPMAGQMQNMMLQQQMGQGRGAMDPQKQQQLLYQMQMQQQRSLQQQINAQNMMQIAPNTNLTPAQIQAQAHVQAQVQHQAQQRNMMAGRPGVPNGQMPPGGMRPQQGIPAQQFLRQVPPAQFLNQLRAFFASSGQVMDQTLPTIGNQPIDLQALFHAVMKFGGYRAVTQSNGWVQVSMALNIHPQQVPAAPSHFKAIYERWLFKYEEMVKMRMQQGGMQKAPQMAPGTPTKIMPPGQMPGQMMQPGQPSPLQQGPMPSPAKPPGGQQAGMNGFPVHGQQPMMPSQTHQQRHSLSRSIQATPTNEDFSMQSPAQGKPGSMSVPGSAQAENQGMAEELAGTAKFAAPFVTNPEEYMPSSREHISYGGVDASLIKVGQELQNAMIDLPAAYELGNVDLHAITKSLQSGIHGEVRLALDVLARITASDFHSFAPTNTIPIPQIELKFCPELVEALVDCAEEQIELLAESSEEASNEIVISPYEDIVRACRIDRLTVKSIPVHGSSEYDLERAADRLICITTIFRNMSWRDDNHPALADEAVIKLLCVVIRYMGTREMLLRSNANTLDIMKDLVTLLSNIAGAIEIPGREQAFCLLQFLLAFAPNPPPTMVNGKLYFSVYDPRSHPYLPHAVDSLAKLLARDEPNRTHYTAIFTNESMLNTSPPCELLTRAFALAIAPIPDCTKEPRHPLPPLVEVRKPIIMQGLLAADIMAGLAPEFDSGVARSWLASGNGFAQNLYALVRQISSLYESQAMRPGRGPPKRDAELVYISSVGINLIRRLCEKARDPHRPAGESGIPPEILPARESVLQALQMHAREWTVEGMLTDLVAYARLVR
ncbi:hypothetical protein QC764_502190 [Podospora pseudoanserina]|uniref:ARID domain-containing protein n=1 Tax=Podospora pseudoanserina TaxID=2609844 RepID=A0ABR0I4Y1_9PEZI|nr:hypothetical protein QC764_502190 [Podospora pseudoanserina]